MNYIELAINFFTAIGLAVSIVFILTIIIGLLMLITDKIEHLKYEYKYKHRFNKKPIAKCYCKDCVHQYEKYKNKYCEENDRYVADDWFCWKATPHVDDPNKE